MPRRCMPHRTAFLVLAATALVLSCAPREAPPPRDAQPPPTAPPAGVRPQTTLPDGFTILLEVPETEAEKAEGLMYRASLPEDRGMLFLLDHPSRPSLWMKDTWIALDAVFLDGQGRVLEVLANLPPCRDEPCPQYSPVEPASAILELAAGAAARHGVSPGAVLAFAHLPGYPTTATAPTPG
jgi:uncharacterized membrane protein (UPF0127 family)